MRKREYRAWDKEQKRMLYNASSMLDNGFFVLQDSLGLPDINNKNIFEGDILEGNIPTSVVMFGEYDNHEQYADHAEGVGFYIKNRDGIDKISRKMIEAYHLKIAGNIYQNPEKIEMSDSNVR
jgi:uncharacterized phage protein (TIGR01671 family)